MLFPESFFYGGRFFYLCHICKRYYSTDIVIYAAPRSDSSDAETLLHPSISSHCNQRPDNVCSKKTESISKKTVLSSISRITAIFYDRVPFCIYAETLEKAGNLFTIAWYRSLRLSATPFTPCWPVYDTGYGADATVVSYHLHHPDRNSKY